jgi:hypothetical protein
VLVLLTLGAPERRLLRGRRGREVDKAEPAAVPTSRATVVRPLPFDSEERASAWLSSVRKEEEARDAELGEAIAVVNRAVHAHRLAAADPTLTELSLERALVARIGFGDGTRVAEGRFQSAWEVPRQGAKTKRSMEAPEERFAAILAGREPALPAEVLVLRARADLDAGRLREAALQARVALESLLSGMPPGFRGRGELEEERQTVGRAANAALAGAPDEHLASALAAAVERMELALKRRRLGR